MLAWLLVLTLHLAAGAEPVAAPAPERGAAPLDPAGTAAVLLSRFPAGSLPASGSVLSALGDLQAHGGADHLTLLDSMVRDEHGTVREAAILAGEAVRARVREERRRQFAARVPESKQIQAWLDTHPADLARVDGSRIGPVEADTVAYAALVLEPAQIVDHPEGLSAQALLSLGEAREDEADPASAVGVYAHAAARGEARALGRIRAFGVDPERLILGMTSGSKVPATGKLDRGAVRMLAREGSVTTVAVLIERASRANERDRSLALEVLEEMLGQGGLPPGARSLVRRELGALGADAAVGAPTVLADEGPGRELR